MKSKKKFTVLNCVLTFFVILFLLVIALMFRANYREAHKNHFTFDSTLVVKDVSSYYYLDTLVLVTLDKIFEYKDITVTIANMPEHISTDDIEVAGFITNDPFKEHNYFLYVNTKRIGISKLTFISHELAHLRQMERGNLTIIPDIGAVYLGDTILYKAIKYKNRPYEIDADEDAQIIKSELNRLIYKH